MKLILLSILFLTGFSNTDLIVQIRNEYNLINKSLDSYTKIESNDIGVYKDMDSVNYSFESVGIYQLALINLIRYYDNQEIKKAIVYFFGGSEDLRSEYYFKNDSLFFVFKSQTYYKSPKWSEDFNESEKEIVENRFYFNNNKLIKWIDSKGEIVDILSFDNSIGGNIISDSELYKNISE